MKTKTFHDFTIITPAGETVDLSRYKNKVVLAVNTATKCGLAPQFDGLEQLHQKFKDKGLVVLGFPSDQFLNQEPETNETIVEACRINHGVTFQLFEKRYGWNNPIRSVTVQAINLVPQDTPRQIDMFMDAAKQDKLERMEKCVEEIRRRFGKDSIRNGVLCQNLRLPPEKAEITMPTGMVG